MSTSHGTSPEATAAKAAMQAAQAAVTTAQEEDAGVIARIQAQATVEKAEIAYSLAVARWICQLNGFKLGQPGGLLFSLAALPCAI